MNLPADGGCRCGACRYKFRARPFVAYTCHCRECQKLTASAFLTCAQVAKESLTVTEGTPKTDRRIADSGNTLTTFFCGRCGSTLFIENAARPRIRTVHVGTLDNPHLVEVSAHIWTKRKLPWVVIPEAHRRFEEAGDWTADYRDDPSRYVT